MQVLQVNKFYHPVVGGIERVVRQYAEGLQDRGHELRVLAATKRGRGCRDLVDGIPVRRVASLGVALSTPLAPTYPRGLASLSADADVVHYHLPNPLAPCSHYLVRPSTPTVVTYHSDIVRQQRVLRVYRPLLEWFLDDVDRIVATSPRLRDNSPFLRARRDKTEVVPIGIDVDAIQPTDVGEAATSMAGEGTILFVGRLNYYKGVSVLLCALAALDEGRLVVVGDGDRRDHLESLADRLGIRDRVRFTGYVDNTELQQYYTTADVFVLPSVEPSEAFGIVQLEAMARGLPVVNTDLPSGVPWVSQDGETGLTVPPGDPERLATAIRTLLTDDRRRREYGRQARARVESKFTERAMLDRTEAIYEDLVEP